MVVHRTTIARTSTTIDDHPPFFTIRISSNTLNINRNKNDNKHKRRTGSTGG
tara:strand:+ start:533 stop:688 length:156 start_codon:yes stop_codon:yes gene_type:complete